ncbi:uncharacterized protein LOC106176918 [Lingula anatina]|uniref:Uncharacterized protein LOC106176918 n=1 Tax=Lingula anatina TaxID=7574 RepID=A0A1S3JY33_LINAN|nr:uncharacterized protein LOC106176918 [Lingula anatina]|eukprot:XP_013414961.1 uncharacterized protein LOC106176918 [Lingula anatina]
MAVKPTPNAKISPESTCDPEMNSEFDIPAMRLKYADQQTKMKVLEQVANETNIKRSLLEKYGSGCQVMLFLDHSDTFENPGSVACYVENTLTDCDDPGFGSAVLYSVEVLTSCLVLGASPVVQWYNCDFCGAESKQPTNHFLSFFQDLETKTETEAEHKLCIASGISRVRPYGEAELVDLSFDIKARNFAFRDYQPDEKITNSTRLLAHYVLTKYFKPVEHIRNYVEDAYNEKMKGYLNIGIHVRATDSWKEVKRVTSLEHWISETKKVIKAVLRSDDMILQILKRKGLNEKLYPVSDESIRIFLATDNTEAILRFKKEFGRQVFWNNVDKVTSFDADGRLWYESNRLAIANARVVLQDVLMLAKCDLLLHGESSISALAHYFNLDLVSYYIKAEEPGVWLPTATPPETRAQLKAEIEKMLNSARERMSKFIVNNITTVIDGCELNRAPNEYNWIDTAICFGRHRFKSQCLNTQNLNLSTLNEVIKLSRKPLV